MGQRAKLDEALRFVRKGDALIVTKADRLARSTANLLAIITDLESRGVGLVVLSLGGQQLDTRNPTSKLLLTMLGAVATFEREIMLERQREGTMPSCRPSCVSSRGFRKGSVPKIGSRRGNPRSTPCSQGGSQGAIPRPRTPGRPAIRNPLRLR